MCMNWSCNVCACLRVYLDQLFTVFCYDFNHEKLQEKDIILHYKIHMYGIYAATA